MHSICTSYIVEATHGIFGTCKKFVINARARQIASFARTSLSSCPWLLVVLRRFGVIARQQRNFSFSSNCLHYCIKLLHVLGPALQISSISVADGNLKIKSKLKFFLKFTSFLGEKFTSTENNLTCLQIQSKTRLLQDCSQ